MIALATTLVLAATLSADPCRTDDPSPAGQLDPEAAAIYRAVGDEARAAGDLPAARVAYREALRRDPTPDNAQAWRAACATADTPAPAKTPSADRFAEGIARMRRGDRAGAIAAFEEARATGEDPAAALLEGVCHFELGHAAAARALFLTARRDPAVAASASFFLGLIALREGEGDQATSLLAEAAAGDPRLAANAAALSSLARRGGRFVFTALADVGYDSNVELVPDGTLATGSSADGSTLIAAGVSGRWMGASGPYGRLGAQYRKQFVISSYDLAQGGGALGARLAGRRGELAVEYGYDFLTLGGAPYLSAHRLQALGRSSARSTMLTAIYAARIESFMGTTTVTTPSATGTTTAIVANDVYSGVRHDGELRAARFFGPAASVALGYRGSRDVTRSDAALSYLEHGPLLALALQAAGAARFSLEGRFSWRRYDEKDAQLDQQRSDQYLDGLAVAELDLGRFWTVRATAAARRAFSNVPDLRYTTLATTLGLVYTFGVL